VQEAAAAVAQLKRRAAESRRSKLALPIGVGDRDPTREQRLVFGEVAGLYDQVRPDYPVALVDEVLAHSGVPTTGAACEVGCGTGRATVLLAARGVPVVAVEPSVEMATVAAANCARFHDVRIEVVSFEDWAPGWERFALVLAAQSWHWVAPDVRLRRAHDALVPRGSLALCWNQPDWSDSFLREPLDELYGRLAPGLAARPGHPRTRLPPSRSAIAEELRHSELFDGLAICEYRRSKAYTAQRYASLLETQSDHRMIPGYERARLLEAVVALIENHGGTLSLEYVTELYLARRST
jgi:SAM-dependent methyltransferase